MDYHKRVHIIDAIGLDEPEGAKHLRNFIKARPGEKYPEIETMEFIKKAFIRILLGEDPKKALKLQTKQGVKGVSANAKRLTKEITIAVMVEEYLMQGMTKDEARQTVANNKGISWKTVKNCCRKPNALIARDMIRRFQNHDALKDAYMGLLDSYMEKN